jgi:RNA polymerase sigma-70 factor (ECF subfamily)
MTRMAGVAVQHDRARFAEVVLPHLAQAHRLARWITGSATDADDVVQEASLRAFRAIGSFGGANARAWVLTIVRNTASTWLTKNRAGPVALAGDMPASVPEAEADPDTPEAVLLRQADAEAVRRAVAALPEPFREVIVLREMDELDYREIARVIDAPIGTVMSRLSRARRMLVDALGSPP